MWRRDRCPDNLNRDVLDHEFNGQLHVGIDEGDDWSVIRRQQKEIKDPVQRGGHHLKLFKE